MGYRTYIGIINKTDLARACVEAQQLNLDVEASGFEKNYIIIDACRYRFCLGNLGWESDNAVYNALNEAKGADLSFDTECELSLSKDLKIIYKLADIYRQKCHKYYSEYEEHFDEKAYQFKIKNLLAGRVYQYEIPLEEFGDNLINSSEYELEMFNLLKAHREYNPETEDVIIFGY